jgi:hypothetical protein
MAAAGSVAVFLDPPHQGYAGDRLFTAQTGPYSRDAVNAPWIHLRDRLDAGGVRVHTVDLLERGALEPAARNLYLSFGPRRRLRRLVQRFGLVRSGFFALECPIVDPQLYRDLSSVGRSFETVYSFSTEESLRPYLSAPVRLEQFQLPNPYDRVDEEQWRRRDRKFLAMINANKLPRLCEGELYTERLRVVEYFNRFGEIDLYGIGWEGPAYRVTTSRVPGRARAIAHHARSRWERLRPPTDRLRVAARVAWRGPAASKAEVLGRYTFAICFENMVLEGWITEKIFDCFVAGTIPVYLGAPDIQRWVPAECFVDMRRFAGYDELRAHLHALTPQETEGYRRAARDYLRSDSFRPFTKEAFADLLAGIVRRDAGVDV